MINEVAYDFENVRIDANNTEIKGISAISYEHGFETEKQFGSGREAFDATEGVYEADDAEITMAEYAYRNLVDSLGAGYMSKAARFDISVAYAHAGEPVITDILERCRIIRDAHDLSQGPDGLEVTITVQVMKVKPNGVDPVAAA